MGASPVAVALYAADALESCGVRYVVGGSLASSISGEPRSTLDVDIVVEMSEADVPRVVAALAPEFEVDDRAVMRAVRSRSSLKSRTGSGGTSSVSCSCRATHSTEAICSAAPRRSASWIFFHELSQTPSRSTCGSGPKPTLSVIVRDSVRSFEQEEYAEVDRMALPPSGGSDRYRFPAAAFSQPILIWITSESGSCSTGC